MDFFITYLPTIISSLAAGISAFFAWSSRSSVRKLRNLQTGELQLNLVFKMAEHISNTADIKTEKWVEEKKGAIIYPAFEEKELNILHQCLIEMRTIFDFTRDDAEKAIALALGRPVGLDEGICNVIKEFFVVDKST